MAALVKYVIFVRIDQALGLVMLGHAEPSPK